jgi:ABC-type bacteriocin/lantibiotic exporter with double-glycine peptidase domain
LAAFNYEMALVAACMIPALGMLAWMFSAPMRRAFLRARETAAQAMSRIEETLASIRTVKAFGTEAEEAARYAEDNWAAFVASRRARMMFVFYRVIANTILGAAHITVLYIGARQVLTHQHGGIAGAAISLGLFQGALLAFGRVSDGGLNLAITWGHLQDVGVGLTRVFEMLEKLPDHDLKSGTEIPGRKVQTLRLENLSFAYDERARVLEGVSLEVRERELIAIAGPSGSGKTTLLSLLIRFFDPASGRILLNDRELREFDLIAYRGLVSAVLQENPLFTGTLLDNITYGRSEADFAEVADAVEMAGLTSFVRDLPSGFETTLGEKGAKLSAGQAQRIGLARAFLRGAPILLLDEPTSALDMATEERVLKGVRQWLSARQGRVAIMMTHRRTAAAAADRTYELNDGRATEAAKLEATPGAEMFTNG